VKAKWEEELLRALHAVAKALGTPTLPINICLATKKCFIIFSGPSIAVGEK
jgi:hypothetical protein